MSLSCMRVQLLSRTRHIRAESIKMQGDPIYRASQTLLFAMAVKSS